MPYPPLSSSSLQFLGGLSGLRPWQTSRFRGLPQARTLASLSQAPNSRVFHESLELFLHLLHLRLLLPSLCALRGRSVFGLGQRLLKGCHLGRGPYNSMLILSFFATTSSLYTCTRYYVPSFSSSCLLAWPSSFSGRARFCFRVSTSAVSATEASSEACIRILT